jgi:prepilin-type N-terminal cleavage/methylation domain-containing protein
MRLSRSSRPSSRRGFTLIELMLSATLMVLILAGAYVCLQAGLSAQRLVDPRLEATQTARVALALLTADLRAACPLDPTTEFIGIDRTLGDVEADNLDFATLNYTPSRPGEAGYCQTSYYLDRDESSGDLVLWRRRNPRIGLDPFTGGTREEIARGIRQLKFEFFDGFEWYDTWGDPNARDRATPKTTTLPQPNLSGLPEAVKITLAFATERRSATPSSARDSLPAPESSADAEPPLVFQTVARIAVPAATPGSSPSASAASARPGPAGGPN